MSEPDFSGIDPLRVPEARRRIAAINEYLALPDSTNADAVRIAGTIGLSRWQFQRLARAWRDHRNPSLIVVGKRGPSARDYGIDPRGAEIARDVIDGAYRDATPTAISIEIERRCGMEEVTPPSRPTVWAWVRRSRADSEGAIPGPGRIVIGRIWFHLPVEGQPAGAMPTLLAAVLLPERTIVAHRISTDPAHPPSVSDIVSDVAGLCTAGAGARHLVMEGDDRRAAGPALDDAGLCATGGEAHGPQAELSRAFGGRLTTLPAIHRRARARPATRRRETRLEQAIDPMAAIEAIEEAIASHNARAPGPTAFDVARG
ncbi:hypothetical protein ACFSGX_01610 [Sphingomonas arantia]|uniref:Uncharacterized protein n=1 Tax=Sphingomonas arantia TaxID=1460676 RepID=A0ABW4TV65_9SPHN